MSEGDFNSYKQIFIVEPNHDLFPKNDFFGEFKNELIWLAVSICGILLGILLSYALDMGDGTLVVPIVGLSGLSLLSFIIYLFTGSGASMFNYSTMDTERKRFYENLKYTILSSNDYKEFTEKYGNL